VAPFQDPDVKLAPLDRLPLLQEGHSFAFAIRPTIARKAHQAPQVPQGQMVCQEMLAPEVNKVNQGITFPYHKICSCIAEFAPLVPKVLLVHPDRWVPKVQKAQLDCLELQASLAIMAHLVRWDQMDHRAQMEPQGQKAHRVPQEPLARKDQTEIKGVQVNLDPRDRLDQMERQEKKEPMAVLEVLEAPDLLEPMETLVHLVQVDPLAHLAQMHNIVLALHAAVVAPRKRNKHLSDTFSIEHTLILITNRFLGKVFT